MAQAAGAPLLGQIPLDPALAKLCDEGKIELFNNEIINKFGESLIKAIATKVD